MSLVTDPALDSVTGKYFTSDGTETESSPISYNIDGQEKLWKISETCTGINLLKFHESEGMD
jgi:hypothetical protein